VNDTDSARRRGSLAQQIAIRETPPVVWRALVATTFREVPVPVALAALDFARALGVPVLGGHIWAIEVRQGLWQLTPGVAFYRLMAARAGCWAGLEWAEAETRVQIDHLQLPEWVECTALRFAANDTSSILRFPQRVYSVEVVRRKADGSPIKLWAEQPRKMLRIRAECLALKTAFPEWLGRDGVPQSRVINPETGEELEQAPRHLSSEDIAAGFDRLPEAMDGASDNVPF
jgi:hypothetical protein